MASTQPATTAQKKRTFFDNVGATINNTFQNVLRNGGVQPVQNNRQAVLNAVNSSLGGAPRVGSTQQVNRMRPQLNYTNPIDLGSTFTGIRDAVGGAVDNLAKSAISTGQKVGNTAGAGAAGVTTLLVAGADKLTGNADYQKNLDRNYGQVKNFLNQKTVTGDQGAFLTLDQAQNRNNDIIGNFAKPVLGAAGEVAPWVLPYGAINKATTPLGNAVAAKVTTGLVGRIAPKAAQYGAEGAINAPIIAGTSAIKQYGQTGEFDPVAAIQEGALGGALTGAGSAAAGAIGAGVRRGANALPLKPAYAAGDDLPIVGQPINAKTAPESVPDQAIPDLSSGVPEQLSIQKGSRPLPQQVSEPISSGSGSKEILKTASATRTKQGDQGTPTSNDNRSYQPIIQELPVYSNNKVGVLDKVFRSTRSIVERQGKSGKELAGKLQQARDSQELFLADIQKSMPTLTKIARKNRNSLKGKDYENFVDAVEGKVQPNNANIAKAVEEWRAVSPRIRERAMNAGLDVGDLGETYYPHIIDYDELFKKKNKSTYNEAINHLVQSGQAKDGADAIKLLSFARDTSRNREFGNLEASRLIDLPFYDKTPNSLISYLNGSTKRIAQTETFGKGDEEALKLIAKIGEEGGDTEAAKNSFDVAAGAKKYNQTSEVASRGIRKYHTTTRLGLAALTNISQSVNTGIVTGNLRTLGAIAKQLSPKNREFAQSSGVISDALLNDIRSQQGTLTFTKSFVGKVINKITVPGMNAVEKFNRSVSAVAGRDYGLRLAQTGKIDTLRKLGVTGEIKGKTLTEAQQIQIARKVVEKTQFKVDPQDLPGWVDSPGGKLVAQFRTFSYNQGKFVSNELLKPAAKGNFLPLGRFLSALPLGYGLYELRRNIAGRPEEEDKVKVAIESASYIGGLGLAFDIYRALNPVGSKYLPADRRVSMAVGAIGGPAAGTSAELVGAVSDVIQRKNLPANPETLEGKVVAGLNDDGYTDLTSASRFALKQIPIIGTPIMNRVLPYKKDSTLTKEQQQQYDALPESEKAAFKSQKESENSVADKDRKAKTVGQYKGQDVIDLPSGKVVVKKDGKYKTYDNREEAEQRDKPKNPTEKYKSNLEKYEKDKASGKLSDVEDFNRRTSLAKESITSKYDKDVLDFYALSKERQDAYFKTNRAEATRLYDKAKALDKELLDKGVVKTSKFKTAARRASTGRSGRTASRGKSGGARSKSAFAAGTSIKSGNTQFAAIRNLVKRPSIKRKSIKAMA